MQVLSTVCCSSGKLHFSETFCRQVLIESLLSLWNETLIIELHKCMDTFKHSSENNLLITFRKIVEDVLSILFCVVPTVLYGTSLLGRVPCISAALGLPSYMLVTQNIPYVISKRSSIGTISSVALSGSHWLLVTEECPPSAAALLVCVWVAQQWLEKNGQFRIWEKKWIKQIKDLTTFENKWKKNLWGMEIK